MALAVVLAGIALAAYVAGSQMGTFCLGIGALILLVRYFDANGHLHEVRQRSTKSLVTDFSVLQRDRRAAESVDS